MTAHEADLRRHAIFLFRSEQFVGLVERDAHGFFNEDVLSRLHRFESDLRVEDIRICNQHGVNL